MEWSLMKGNQSEGGNQDKHKAKDDDLACLSEVVLLITLLSLMLYFLWMKLGADIDDDDFYDEEEGQPEQQEEEPVQQQ